MYDCLNAEFPQLFRKAYGKMKFMEMDRYLETLESINTQSHRKRFVRVVGDIYGLDTKEGKRIIVLNHEEKLNYRKWNDLKRLINTKQEFLYRPSECGVIVFVNLSHGADSLFVQRFKKNTDIISVLVSKEDCSNPLAPDFIPTEDVISVTDPARLLAEYTESGARMVIIGDELDDDYKNALLDLKRYDKFVRMMVVPALDYSDLDHFIRQVKLVYNSNRWE